MSPQSHLRTLTCARCGVEADPDQLQTFCTCGGTWLAGYDLHQAATTLTRDSVRERPPGLWRWAEVLPVRAADRRRGLGEGDTPLRESRRIGPDEGFADLRFKDEGVNPGGSFKARGMAVAVARAVELGAASFALPSAGNAGAAAAAYGAYWETPVRVSLPVETPEPFRVEIAAHGALCHDVDGDIAQAGAWLAEQPEAAASFFLNTLKEPYRVEGKKTMGYELVEQWGHRWPDVVVYPTGGGTGIVGMWKAHVEMTALGLVDGPPPRFVVVQATGCAPLVRAYQTGAVHATPWENATTEANGLRVPGSIGDHLILTAVRDSGGTAVAVSDSAMDAARTRIAREEGIDAAPEAAATLAAVLQLRESGWFDPAWSTALFFTGNGVKYRPHPEAA